MIGAGINDLLCPLRSGLCFCIDSTVLETYRYTQRETQHTQLLFCQRLPRGGVITVPAQEITRKQTPMILGAAQLKSPVPPLGSRPDISNWLVNL